MKLMCYSQLNISKMNDDDDRQNCILNMVGVGFKMMNNIDAKALKMNNLIDVYVKDNNISEEDQGVFHIYAFKLDGDDGYKLKALENN